VPDKEDLLKKIFKAGLFASSHYVPATDIFFRKTSPHADELSRSVLNLFTDRYFPTEKTGEMVHVILEHLQGA
jgi:hypothetical protein